MVFEKEFSEEELVQDVPNDPALFAKREALLKKDGFGFE